MGDPAYSGTTETKTSTLYSSFSGGKTATTTKVTGGITKVITESKDKVETKTYREDRDSGSKKMVGYSSYEKENVYIPKKQPLPEKIEEKKTEEPPKIQREQVAYSPKEQTLIYKPTGEVIATNVIGFGTSPTGYIKDITTVQDGKNVTYDPYTGEMKGIQQENVYVDLRTGKARYIDTGKELNVLKEGDYGKLIKMGVGVELTESAKALSDWYYKNVEKEAKTQGAEALAKTVAESINRQMGGQYITVEQKGSDYVLKAYNPKAWNSQLVMENALAGYSTTFRYADYETKADGTIVIKQKPVSDQSYYFSKAFGGKQLPTTLSVEGEKVLVEFEGGKKVPYSDLSKIEQTALKPSYLEFTKELRTEAIFKEPSLMERYNPFAGGVTPAYIGEKIDFKEINGKATPFLDNKAYSDLTKAQKEAVDTALGQAKATPEYIKQLKIAEEVTGSKDIGLIKTSEGWEFKNLKAWGYLENVIKAYGYIPTTTPEGTAGTIRPLSLEEVEAQKSFFDFPASLGYLLQQTPVAGSRLLHEANKVLSGIERSGIDIPFYEGMTPEFEKAVEYKLNVESARLGEELGRTSTETKMRIDTYVTGGAGETAYRLDTPLGKLPVPNIVASLIEVPTTTTAGVVLTAPLYYVAGSSAIGGLSKVPAVQKTAIGIKTIADMPIRVGIGGVTTAGSMLKSSIAVGTISAGLHETVRVGAEPEFKVLSDPRSTGTAFLTGAVAGLTYNQFLAVASPSLSLVPKTIGYGYKSIFASGMGGYYAGALSSFSEDALKGKDIDMEKAKAYAYTGALIGAGFQTLSLGYQAIGSPKIWGGKVNWETVYPEAQKHYYAGIYYQRGASAQPLVGLYRNIGTPSIILGKPNIQIHGVTAFPLAETPFQTSILKPAYYTYSEYLGSLTPSELNFVREQIFKFAGSSKGTYVVEYLMPKEGGLGVVSTRFKEGMNILDFSYFSKDPTKTALSLKETIELSELFKKRGVADKIIEILERDKSGLILGGSASTKMVMGEEFLRVPKDLDLTVISGSPEDLAKTLVKELEPYYGKGNIQISKDKTSLVEIKYKGQFVHGFDIHSQFGDVSASDVSKVLNQKWVGYGYPTKAPFITEEGYQILALSEQGARKGVSALTPRTFGFSPEAHRFKDIGDFLNIAEYQATIEGRTDVLQSIETYKGTVPESLPFGSSSFIVSPFKYYVSPSQYISAGLPISSALYRMETPDSYKIGKITTGSKYKIEPVKVSTYGIKQADLKYTSDYKYTSPKISKPYSYYAKPSPTPKPYYTKPSPPTKTGYYTPPSPKPSPPPKYDYGYSPPYGYSYKYGYSPSYGYNYGYKAPYSYNYSYNYGYKPYYSPPYKPPEVPPPPVLLKIPKGGDMVAKTIKNVDIPRTAYKTGTRGLFADLFSVSETQLLRGKATQPNLRKRPYVWQYEHKGKVPTAEMLRQKRQKTREQKIRGLFKNVRDVINAKPKGVL